MAEAPGHPYWPFFDLRIRTPRVELRLPTDDDLVALAALAADGVHDADRMPFLMPWALAPSPRRERGVLQWGWRHRAGLTPDSWHLGFCVWEDGEICGVQDVGAEQFPRARSVSSGSWLGRRHQGRGLGKEMRAAVLHLAFAGLGAVEAHSGAFVDNEISQRVSRAVGYEDNGFRWSHRGDDDAALQVLFRMSRERWEEVRRHDIEIDGLDACLPLLGLAPDLSPLPSGD